MTYPVAFSEEADLQLKEIEAYLSQRFYPANAERFVRRLTRPAPHWDLHRIVGPSVTTWLSAYERPDLSAEPQSISRLWRSGC
jgi:predicted glycoside hydrolase/deacetylase ChbG (UPF0249 family)